MVALDLQEQEQVEALKAWWKENAKWLIAAIVLGLAVYGGVVGWKKWQAKQNSEAAALYVELVKQVASNDPKRINDAAAVMVSKYGSTIYTARAQLLAARVNLQAGDIPAATKQLQWVADSASEDGLQHAARLQLASVLLDQKKYDDALKLLAANHAEAYDGLYLDLRGDVLAAQGKTADARASYQQALTRLDERSMLRPVVQMKLDGLGGAK
jgi:predicted negative regulator of RcsB-dependent stress response